MDPESNEGRAVAARLVDERTRIEADIARLITQSEDDGAITRTGDAAADTTTVETNREMKSELEAQLAEVDAAMHRLATGTYGIDEVTGEPIDPARLEAFPVARTNI